MKKVGKKAVLLVVEMVVSKAGYLEKLMVDSRVFQMGEKLVALKA